MCPSVSLLTWASIIKGFKYLQACLIVAIKEVQVWEVIKYSCIKNKSLQGAVEIKDKLMGLKPIFIYNVLCTKDSAKQKDYNFLFISRYKQVCPDVICQLLFYLCVCACTTWFLVDLQFWHIKNVPTFAPFHSRKLAKQIFVVIST